MRYDSKLDFDREEMAIINEVNTDASDETIHPMNAKRRRTGDIVMIANDETVPHIGWIYPGGFSCKYIVVWNCVVIFVVRNLFVSFLILF